MEVRKSFGPGHKESIYQNGFAEELTSRGIKFGREVSIKIYSPKTGKLVGMYRPDFLVENKVIVETKAVRKIPKEFLNQLYDYLRNSEYELGYFINFSSPKLYIKRIIYTNNKKFFMAGKLAVFSFVLAVLSVFAPYAYGARVYFDPPPRQHKVGDSIIIDLYVDTEQESINAVDINILIPALLRVKSISKNGSVIQLWVSEPSFSGKTVTLTGGIPGGLKTSKGLIVELTLEAVAVGEGNIAFMPGSSVLLNDGQGTQLDLKTAGGPLFKIVPKPKETAEPSPELKEKTEEEKPKEEVKKEEKIPVIGKPDKKKPDKLEILFGKDPRVFEGENFVSFFAVDADSGVDHYEIKLGKESFKVAKPPYLLKDVEPRTVLRVRAYDTAGNYAEKVYPGLIKRIWWWIIKLL